MPDLEPQIRRIFARSGGFHPLCNTLTNKQFSVATPHGISEQTCGANNDPEAPRQGSAQGLDSGVMLWIGMVDTTLKVYRMNCYGAVFKHPSQLILLLWAYAQGFKDDIALLMIEQGIIFAKRILLYNQNHLAGSNWV